jgi:hypothetical protein
MQVTHRLSPELYDAVRRKAGFALSVNHDTTSLEAGFQLGMARVLDILREDFTVEATSVTKAEPPGGR